MRASSWLERALFARRTAWSLALTRVALGTVLFGWAVAALVDAGTWFGPDGLARIEAAAPEGWRGWADIDTRGEATLALSLLAVAALMIASGWFPSTAAVVSFGLLVALQRRSPVVLNSGDLVLRNLIGLLALTPSSAAWSLDRLRRVGPAGTAASALIAPWGVRLLQLQLVVVYLFAVWSKSGGLWRNGTAVSTVLRLEDLQRVGAPDFLVESVTLVAALTWGTLAIEFAAVAFLWHRGARRWIVPALLLLHAGIDLFLLVGFFGLAMGAGILVFLPESTAERILRRRPAQEVSLGSQAIRG